MKNVEVMGVRNWDYPDFSDAFISYAEHDDGTPYTEDELDAIPPEEVFIQVLNWWRYSDD